MTKLETELSSKWILNLKKQCSAVGERIKVFKIHGGSYQDPGISDWLGCYQGIFLAIEFKVDDSPTDAQYSFLADIYETKGIAMIINFKNTKPVEYSWGQERQVLNISFSNRKQCVYIFSY